MSKCLKINKYWFVCLSLVVLPMVGCGAPTDGDFYEEEGLSDPGGLQFNGGAFGNGGGGGVPGAARSQGENGPLETGAFDGGEDAFSVVFEEYEDVVFGDEYQEPDHTQNPDSGGEGSNPFAYECDPGDEEECETECGSIGFRVCGKLWGPCLPPDEVCNGFDDNCDGQVDEGVTNACGGCGPLGEEVCNGIDDNCDGSIDEGVTNACGTCGDVPTEVCNGADDDCDGSVDEGLLNACGTCGPTSTQELCDGIDNNCNGQVDEACLCEMVLNISGDCVTAACPAQCPYPVGCNIIFQGGDKRGCVAAHPQQPLVYFQEGDQCGAGSLSGTLTCSSAPGEGLTPNTCAINKPQPIWVTFPSQCPDTD